jgi:hypothetical protein
LCCCRLPSLLLVGGFLAGLPVEFMVRLPA